jgi:predicted MPP superfamily phosphohydrolase
VAAGTKEEAAVERESVLFLMNEILLAMPALLYSGLRLRWLLERTLWKNVSTGLFILLLAAYPLSDALAHGSLGGGSRALVTTGYYALPYLLYFMLLVVLTDLVVGGLRLLGAVRPETLRRPGMRLARFWAMVLVPGAIVFGGILNFAHLQITPYSVEVPKKASPLDRLRIVFVSDFHLGDMTDPGFMPGFVDKVNALHPDLILIGGDVVEGDRRGEAAELFTSQFRRLRAPYGVFGVLGNHEGFGGGSREAFFAQSGITLLKDEIREIGGAFLLAGRLDGGRRNQAAGRKAIADLLRGAPTHLPLILVDHRPTDIDAVSRTEVDIQFSGHTHDGQLFPVNFITSRQYELTWGYMKKGNTHFIVSCGVQLWGPRVRTVGVSEIVSVDVSFR